MWRRAKNIYHLIVAAGANLWFGFPSRKLVVIGVTGTDGKTTTTSLIYHILNKSGKNVSMISSVGAIINGKKFDVGFHVTTPSSWQLQNFINMAVKDGSNGYLVLELTSHAIDQFRAWRVSFKIGVLTNVSEEHLDYHKTYENYVDTKYKLIKTAEVGIVNKDDKSYKFINVKSEIRNKKLTTYGFNNSADVNLKNIGFEIKIPGDFNKYNVLAAIAACESLGISKQEIKDALSSFSLPMGRLEKVYDKDFSVIIDFAHTPNSFEQLLKALRKDVSGRIIHVFGAAGKRDFAKRPLMGRNSSKYSDIIVLTAEDPRDESIDKINSEIASGIDKKFKLVDLDSSFKNQKEKHALFKINSRQEAIELAVSLAKKDDLVVITGKSHEKSMNYGKGEVSWNESEVIKKALEKLKL